MRVIRSLAYHLILILAGIFFVPVYSHAYDQYDKLARELSDAANYIPTRKVAILPFDYLDGRKSAGALIISEELTDRIVRLHKLTIIERTLVEKLLSELKFQTTGAIDPKTAQELGKGLGVEAIITGTLVDINGGSVRVNSRVIMTQTYEIVASASVKLKKTWQDGPPPEIQPQTAQGQPEGQATLSQTTFQQPQPAYRRPQGPSNGYADFFFGLNGAKMDLTFKNTSSTIDQSELGFVSMSPNPFRSVGFEDLETKNTAPIGFRIGGTGDVVGGDMEISYFTQTIKAQSTTHTVNGTNRGSFSFFVDDYLKVSVFNLLSGDLTVRFPINDTIHPYLGLGLGLTLNTVSSPYVKVLRSGSMQGSLQETSPGFLFRIPFGLRVNLSDKVGLFGEGRYYLDTFSFKRNRSFEDDRITLHGLQFLFGLSLLF